MAMSMRVVVPPHPLIGHWLSVLRNRHTPAPIYGSAMAELGRWLTYEALRDWLPVSDTVIDGGHGATTGQVVDASVPLLALPMLTDGLGLWDGARAVLPAASVHHLGPDGDGLPATIPARCGVIVFAAAIASGGRLESLLEALAQRGVQGRRLRVVAALVSAPALNRIAQHSPELALYTSGIDPALDAQGELDPGIGPVSERLFGHPLPSAADGAAPTGTAA